jgi:hypothetical protein
MSTTAAAAALMMAFALGAAELPGWLGPAQWHAPIPPQSSPIIVPTNSCRPRFETTWTGRCLPDCRQGGCKRIRVAEAQQRGAAERPLPVPMYGAGCPAGYSASPTSGTCTPLATTRCRAFPSTGSCPNGFGYSPTSRMCVETNCH